MEFSDCSFITAELTNHFLTQRQQKLTIFDSDHFCNIYFSMEVELQIGSKSIKVSGLHLYDINCKLYNYNYVVNKQNLLIFGVRLELLFYVFVYFGVTCLFLRVPAGCKNGQLVNLSYSKIKPCLIIYFMKPTSC